MRPRLPALGLAIAGLVGCGVLALGPGAGEAAPKAYPTCAVLRVATPGDHGLSTLYRVDLASGAMTRVRTLDRRVDAIGYHRGQGLAYGVAGAHVVSLTADGALTVLGRVQAVHGASAGTVMGDALVVRVGSHLRSVSIDPSSPAFLTVVASVRLWPAALPRTVDDFDARGGLLYGVTTVTRYHGRVVRIDPRTGRVREVGTARLPGGRSYGSAAIAPDGALFAASNRTADHDWHGDGRARSRLVRVELTPKAKPVEIAAWPVSAHSDMTGCVTARPAPPTTTPTTTTAPTTPPPTTPPPTTPPPTTPPPTRPPATTTAPPAPTTVPTTTTNPAAPPLVPPLPPRVPPLFPPRPPAVPPGVPPAVVPIPGAPPVPAPEPVFRSLDRPEQAEAPGITATERKRRWGMTTLVLLLGAAAVAGASHRSRH